MQDYRGMGNEEFGWKHFHVHSSDTRIGGIVQLSKRFISTFMCFLSRFIFVIFAMV